MAATKASSKRTTSRGGEPNVWTDEEREAMQEHAKEVKRAQRRGGAGKEAGEADVLEKIAEMPAGDRAMAEKIHAIVKTVAPELTPRTWYGMPAYAKDGKVVCFFTPGEKFKERYASFGFNAAANLDEGSMWPTAWALTDITPDVEAQIAALVKKAVRS
jgi:uncharacterized protein YdhG (YjbR/CyaY superfamily)